MKILKLIADYDKNMKPDDVKSFIYKNLPQELITGLEMDDPYAIQRCIKLIGLEKKIKLPDLPKVNKENEKKESP